MKEITEKIDSISAIGDHYLIKAKAHKHRYWGEFLGAANVLKPLLTAQEFDNWCQEKMLLKSQAFAEKTFIQFAVETAVVSFFGEKFPTSFKVEAKINPTNDKDVDCRFEDAGFIFNIEVKCSDFVSKEKINSKDAYKYSTVGRLTDKGEGAKEAISSALDEGHAQKGEPLKAHLASKNMDNNLKEFLELTNEKVNPTPNENEVNILIVGCGDETDMQSWVNYLWAPQGLFTPESFADRTKYQNVDLVVLTNQYFKHNKYFDKAVRDCWSIKNGFNLIFCNPFRRLQKEKAIKHFIKIFPNYSEEIDAYLVPGPAPSYVKDSVKVRWFVKDYLEKGQGKYLFEEKPA